MLHCKVLFSVWFVLQDGSTALMFATQSGHIEAVKLLLDSPSCKADIKDKVN